MTATDNANADALSTGELFSVRPFTLDDLTGTAPAHVTRLARSQGAVDQLDVVEFPIAPAAVTAGTPAHFGIFPTAARA